MLTALTGYLVSPRVLVDLTAKIASTARLAKNLESLYIIYTSIYTVSWTYPPPPLYISIYTYDPIILELMEVLAALIRHSLPRVSTLVAISLAIKRQASLEAKR